MMIKFFIKLFSKTKYVCKHNWGLVGVIEGRNPISLLQCIYCDKRKSKAQFTYTQDAGYDQLKKAEQWVRSGNQLKQELFDV